ncbi:Eco29kI family restriction endonuclease [Hyalangium gracile]|uniref:Eco29kI family restriction endonuclease n=1 Tax=Hyalangium gracile TaxID=394092 RepID=UPI001CCE7E36|nr:Eco29kI family restriction endonuclease [Hyalangium gracile]
MPGKTIVIKEYNPLDYANLTRNCVEELMRQGPYRLEFNKPFAGAGVYALFYVGPRPEYRPIKSRDATWPIYVGKAVPPGARKGGKSGQTSRALYIRLRQHLESINQTRNLEPHHFRCRFLVVTPLWITMAERFLIEKFQPAWNVCIEGFGNHHPGKGRAKTQRSLWDILHPGRDWAEKLLTTRTTKGVKARLRAYLKTHYAGAELPPLIADADRYMEDETGDDSED